MYHNFIQSFNWIFSCIWRCWRNDHGNDSVAQDFNQFEGFRFELVVMTIKKIGSFKPKLKITRIRYRNYHTLSANILKITNIHCKSLSFGCNVINLFAILKVFGDKPVSACWSNTTTKALIISARARHCWHRKYRMDFELANVSPIP